MHCRRANRSLTTLPPFSSAAPAPHPRLGSSSPPAMHDIAGGMAFRHVGLLCWMLLASCTAGTPAGRPPRRLLGAGAASGSNSSSSRAAPQPDASLASLGWLEPPQDGWPVWQLPSHQHLPGDSEGARSGVGGAATLLSPEQRGAAARLIVQQITAHLADPADDEPKFGYRCVVLEFRMRHRADALAIGTSWHCLPCQAPGQQRPPSSRSLDEQEQQAGSAEAVDTAAALAAAAAHRFKLAVPAPAAAGQAAGQAAAAAPPAALQEARPAAVYFTTTAAAASAAAAATEPAFTTQPVPRGRTRFPAPFHSAFPPTGVPLMPRPRALGCPLPFSVLAFGALANGQADCSRALAAADNSTLQMLYFPRGTYRLTRSLTLQKHAVMGEEQGGVCCSSGVMQGTAPECLPGRDYGTCMHAMPSAPRTLACCFLQLTRATNSCMAGIGTRFLLDANVRLTLAAQPVRAPRWHDPMFFGPGEQAGQGAAVDPWRQMHRHVASHGCCHQGQLPLKREPSACAVPLCTRRRRPGAHGPRSARGVPRLVVRPRSDRWQGGGRAWLLMWWSTAVPFAHSASSCSRLSSWPT